MYKYTTDIPRKQSLACKWCLSPSVLPEFDECYPCRNLLREAEKCGCGAAVRGALLTARFQGKLYADVRYAGWKLVTAKRRAGR